MAWALIFDGVNDNVQVGSALVLGANFKFTILLKTDSDVTSEQWIIGHWNDNVSDRSVALRVVGGQLQSFISSNGTTTDTGPTFSISSNTIHTIELEKVGAILSLNVDSGTAATAAVFSGAVHSPTSLTRFGCKNTNIPSDFMGMELQTMTLEISSVIDNAWDATASSHAAGTPVLTDTVGANNATGVNMPTDGSAWVDLGGSGVTVTGTATPTQTEADIVVGGKTIILTLAGDTFVSGTTSEDAIAAGSDSDKTGANKWDALIKTDLDNTDLVLSVGDTVATITLPAYASYNTDETETITWTIPSASLTTGTSDIIATPTFTVTEVVSGFQAAWAINSNIMIQ
jgi:hypothetical protein